MGFACGVGVLGIGDVHAGSDDVFAPAAGLFEGGEHDFDAGGRLFLPVWRFGHPGWTLTLLLDPSCIPFYAVGMIRQPSHVPSQGHSVPFAVVACLVLTLTSALPAQGAEMSQGVFQSAGEERSYTLAVPKGVAEVGPNGQAVPLVILLHGSGRDGKSQVMEWRKLAEKEGFLAVGPDSLNSEYWEMPTDGPDMLRDLVKHLGESYSVDPRRVYLFGHSAGAVDVKVVVA